jgi:hypothetical protein
MNKRVSGPFIINKPSSKRLILEESPSVTLFYIKPKKYSHHQYIDESKQDTPVRTYCPVALWISILTLVFLLISSFFYFLAYLASE